MRAREGQTRVAVRGRSARRLLSRAARGASRSAAQGASSLLLDICLLRKGKAISLAAPDEQEDERGIEGEKRSI